MKVTITKLTSCPNRVAMCKLLARILDISLVSAKELIDKGDKGFEINLPESTNILHFANSCGLYGYGIK